MRLLTPARSLVVAAAVIFTSIVAHAETVKLMADLKSSSEVPANDSKGHGMVMATLDTDTHMLTYDVKYEDLTGPAVAAHFHGPAEPGKNAGPKIFVKKPLESPIHGTATLTPEEQKDILDGMYYFNIHTAEHGGGEVRGQLTKQ